MKIKITDHVENTTRVIDYPLTLAQFVKINFAMWGGIYGIEKTGANIYEIYDGRRPHLHHFESQENGGVTWQHLFIILARLFSPWGSLAHCLPPSILSKEGRANDFLDYLFYLIFPARDYMETLQKLYEINNGPGAMRGLFFIGGKL